MRKIISMVAVVTATVLWAEPQATVVSAVAVDGGTALSVSYTLTEDAIVTLSVATNADGAAFLADGQVTALSGDVNCRVSGTSGGVRRQLRWDCARDDVSLPETGVSVVLTAWRLDQPPNVMTFTPAGRQTRFYTSVEALPGGLADVSYRSTTVVMRKIPAKGIRFLRGASETDSYTRENENAVDVTLTNDYYICIYPITVSQYFNWTGVTSWSGNAQYFEPKTIGETPVCGVSYDMLRGTDVNWPTTGHTVSATSLIGMLRERTGLLGLDLPTDR